MPRADPSRSYDSIAFHPSGAPCRPPISPYTWCAALPRHRFMCCCTTSLTNPNGAQAKRASLMETSLGFINWRSKKAPIEQPASGPSIAPRGGWPAPATAPSSTAPSGGTVTGESTEERFSNRPPAEVRV